MPMPDRLVTSVALLHCRPSGQGRGLRFLCCFPARDRRTDFDNHKYEVQSKLREGQRSIWVHVAEESLHQRERLRTSKGGTVTSVRPSVASKQDDRQEQKRVGRILSRQMFGKKYISESLGEECGQGRLKETLNRLDREDIQVDFATYASFLRRCGNAKALTEGRRVHDHIIRSGHERDRFLGNLLVEMYGKCGALKEARSVFDKMHPRNVFSWTIMIAAYAKHDNGKEALQIYRQMQAEGVKPDKITFISILGACSSPAALEQGKEIHASVVNGGFMSDVVVRTAIVNMYGKCGSLEHARKVFDNMHAQDVVLWNAMITAYAQNGHGKEALQLYLQMQGEGLKPNRITFISILGACSTPAALSQGKEIHTNVFERGFQSDAAVGSALVNMYSKCGSVEDAWKVFDKICGRNVVVWNAMIAAYAQHGHGKEALRVYRQMQEEGVKPNEITFISVLGVCSSLAALAQGKEIHDSVIDGGFESDIVVGTALVNMYGKCGSLEDAERVFNKMQERDVVSWTAMITAFAHDGHGKEALQLYRQMQGEGVKPDKFTFISVLGACSNLAALEQGKEIHASLVDGGFESDVVVGNALVNMYGKCGCLEDAWRVFDRMHGQNVVSWTAMIASYAQHGLGNEALQIFRQMQREGVKPDEITFISVFCACSHAGLVDEGWRFFGSMNEDHGITPTVEHYACMIDLFGRAGRLEEAEDFINKMPFQPDVVAWRTLLGACRVHGDVQRGKRAAEHVIRLDPQNAAPYVLLSNIYAAEGRWDDVAKVRKEMENNGIKKQAGCSLIEVENRVHEFVGGDRSHPQTEEIYAELERLSRQMEEAGYVPNTKVVLHDVEEEQKECLLWYHSEKLAIAFGLITMPPGKPLRIVKNLRVCSDCHTATKFISKLMNREIIVRDANRFHHFNHGVCSCGDFW